MWSVKHTITLWRSRALYLRPRKTICCGGAADTRAALRLLAPLSLSGISPSKTNGVMDSNKNCQDAQYSTFFIDFGALYSTISIYIGCYIPREMSYKTFLKSVSKSVSKKCFKKLISHKSCSKVLVKSLLQSLCKC